MKKIVSLFILFLAINYNYLTYAANDCNNALEPWKCEDITETKHNLSASGKGIVTTTTTEICVFCHTPHASKDEGPLWNRSFSTANYSMYQPQANIKDGKTYFGSFDAAKFSTTEAQPTGYSKLCLSCHDGTIAVNKLINKPGSGGYDPGGGLIGNDPIYMPFGKSGWAAPGEQYSGDTRFIGTDLSNDHPISFRMTEPVIAADGEIKCPDANCDPTSEDWRRKDGVRLYPIGFGNTEKTAVQCTSCHNPHTTNSKFLRGSLQNQFAGDTVNRTQICESCHTKPGWVGSTHENITGGDTTFMVYRTAPNESPELDGNTVAQHGCLNCHDTHTMQGSDRLHRNGAGLPGDTYGNNADISGKTPAIENTCFQCHIGIAGSGDKVPNLGVDNFLISIDGDTGNLSGGPPNIKGVFDKNTNTTFSEMTSGGSSMPLDRSWAGTTQGDTNAKHQPVFVSEATLSNRQDSHDKIQNSEEKVLNKPASDNDIHVECTDCHNPHQVTRQNRLRGMKGITISGDNVVGGDSGFLPLDGRSPEGTGTIGSAVKDTVTNHYEPLVYEICLRCHGDSYDYNMPYKAKGTPAAGNSREARDRGHTGTFTLDISPDFSNVNQMTINQFGASNKAREFDPDANPRASGISTLNYNTSYHPVAAPGRNHTVAMYNQLMKAFKLCKADPITGVFVVDEAYATPCTDAQYIKDTSEGRERARNVLSKLTMQCTDCHNSNAFSDTDLSMDNGGLFGPTTGLSDGSSYRRPTDRPSNIPNDVQNDPNFAQGPHGSTNPRILRAPYNTTLRGSAGSSTISDSKSPGSEANLNTQLIFNNFGLCFQCHEKKVFLAGVNYTDEPARLVLGTNFGASNHFPSAIGGFRRDWTNNLHVYHLVQTGAYCHECHNNVHSNLDANNTSFGYTITSSSVYLPLDGSNHDGGAGVDNKVNTHLINFGPQAEGTNDATPVWFAKTDGSTPTFRCALTCHGVNMSGCGYSHGGGAWGAAGSGGGNWACGEAYNYPIFPY